jgi:methylmalonyl-CoA/ethylmalonyl-CoA epimerase
MSAGWRVIGLHHVAIAHADDPTCEDALTSMIGVPAHVEEGPGFLERMYELGPTSVQTLEATGDGVVRRFLDKRGPGLHHLAFEVDAIDPALSDLAVRGVQLIDREARLGGMGTRIAFLHPAAFGGVLVELVEDARRAKGSVEGEKG